MLNILCKVKDNLTILQEIRHESCTSVLELCNFHALWDNVACLWTGITRGQYCLGPKMDVPTLTMLLPWHTAMCQSWLMPQERMSKLSSPEK